MQLKKHGEIEQKPVRVTEKEKFCVPSSLYLEDTFIEKELEMHLVLASVIPDVRRSSFCPDEHECLS